MTTPYQRWVGREIQVDGIRWRITEITDVEHDGKQTVRFDRIYEKKRDAPPIPRDPDPVGTIPC